jgi:PAS domain S-box-containing protein
MRHLGTSRVQEVLQAGSASVVLVSCQGLDSPIVYASSGFAELTGYPAHEILGRNGRFLLGPESDRAVVAEIRDAIRDGRPFEGDLVNYRKDGEAFVNRLRLTPLVDAQDRVTYYVGEQVRADGAAVPGASANIVDAEEAQRRRVARELHDEVSQTLALLALELGALRRLARPEAELEQPIKSLTRRVQELSSQVHRISRGLHPAVLERLGLAEALRSLGEEMSPLGLKVHLGCGEIPDTIPAATALALYRVVQESLHNAQRHGGVEEARVLVHSSAAEIRAEVRDEGRGFDPSATASGLGLIGMNERLLLVGGHLEVRSAPGQGTTVIARIPRAAWQIP